MPCNGTTLLPSLEAVTLGGPSLSFVPSVFSPEGWYGEGGGRGVQDWEHMYTRGGFMLCMAKPIQYCKVIIPANPPAAVPTARGMGPSTRLLEEIGRAHV